MMKQNTSNRRPQEKTAEEYKYPISQRRLLLNTSTKWQRKLWSGIQVSELAQRKLHSEMYTSTQGKIFFFLNRSDFEQNGVEGVE